MNTASATYTTSCILFSLDVVNNNSNIDNNSASCNSKVNVVVVVVVDDDDDSDDDDSDNSNSNTVDPLYTTELDTPWPDSCPAIMNASI
jgi:hypothetical protein